MSVPFHTGASLDQSGCRTADKTINTCTIIGLQPNTTYYFVVRTFTPAHIGRDPGSFQQNDLLSVYSTPLQATTGQNPASLPLIAPQGTTSGKIRVNGSNVP